MNKKKIKKTAIIVLACMAVGGAGVFFYYRYKFRDLTRYAERLLEIELKDCIETAEGDVKVCDWWGNEYSHIKLKVKDGEEENVVNVFKKRCGTENRYSPNRIIPGYSGHRFAKEIKDGEIQFLTGVFMEGKGGVKTRDILIYIVLVREGQMYIYVMG